jgi:hypothetical protein
MKNRQSTLVIFIVLILVAALYRLMPRPWGFAPQIAMALFGGAIITDKRLAFALPILSMFVSDLIYHLLYTYGRNHGGSTMVNSLTISFYCSPSLVLPSRPEGLENSCGQPDCAGIVLPDFQFFCLEFRWGLEKATHF